jgi:hypothetical protein
MEGAGEKDTRMGRWGEVEKVGWDADGKSMDRLSVSRDIGDASL